MGGKLEIACFDVASALQAAAAGADRIELCTDYGAGGLTPPAAWLRALRPRLGIPVHVMIRPHAGTFGCSAARLAEMKTQLAELKRLGADGFVFGILDPGGLIDTDYNRQLVHLASPLPCTFHRAFDGLADKAGSLDLLIDLGFRNLLTSGLPGPALAGRDTIRQLVQRAAGRICVIAGGGIRAGNVADLASATAAGWFHSAARSALGDAFDAAEVIRLKQVLTSRT